MPSLKVLIADDSVVYRSQIRAALATFPWVEVTGAASNGRLAIERLKQVPADLLILDLEMPEMDGLQTLAEIARQGIRVQVLVFSSVTKRGAEITFEALRMGAKDFVAKPGSTGASLVEGAGAAPHEKIRQLLEPKLRALFPELAASPVAAVAPEPKPATAAFRPVLWDAFRPQALVIGSSTGGPAALEKLFQCLGGPLEIPILIAQHMPPVFTASLAERISRLSGIPAREGVHGEPVEAGRIYIAPGDFHMSLEGTAIQPRIRLDQGPLVNSVRPAVDPLFASAARIYREKCLGAVLTGMGQDGKTGAVAIKEAGGAVLIQDRESSVVYGMPGAVLEAGAYDRICAIEELARLIAAKSGLPGAAGGGSRAA